MATKIDKEKKFTRKKPSKVAVEKKRTRKNTFPDSDTYSLDMTIGDFITPRLRRFRAIEEKVLGKEGFGDTTKKEWLAMLDAMVFSWQKVAEGYGVNREKDLKVEYGLDLFRDYLFHLWW
jgi:hypothetical protein